MDLLKYSTYLFSGSICLTMAIILLLVRNLSANEDFAYTQIKRHLAYSALIDVFIDVLVLMLLNNLNKLEIFNFFIIPTAYSIQLLLITIALLSLIHASSKIRLALGKAFIPLIAIVATYVAGGLLSVSSCPVFSFQWLREYNSTVYAKVSSTILYIFIITCFIISMYVLVKQTLLYVEKLKNYFSGNEVLKGRQIAYLAYCFFGYFILAAVDFIISDDTINIYIMMINTIIFICVVVFVMNIERAFIGTRTLDCFDMHNSGDSFESVMASSSQKSTDKSTYTESGIVYAIHQWEQREDKPYLKDGILVADVSKSIGINEVQLSFILNHSLKNNFNTWINKLRIEEGKRLMEDNPQLNLSEVAISSGFVDLASFSKAFKRVTGESPSLYKKRITSDEYQQSL